ncbi:MAG: hypothetical protein JWQ04_2118 [Pedosphaera sp.]|nr:hypothetical protein [Pedosphaera sp.]
MSHRTDYKVVIQSRKTQLYFQAWDAWTDEIYLAKNFVHVVDACLFASKSGMRQCEVIMSFGDPMYDLRINVPANNRP